MAVRENASLVVLFSENGYQVFVKNGSTEWSFDAGEERMVRDRQLPAGISVDLVNTDLDSDPSNLGTLVLVDSSSEQGYIRKRPGGDCQPGQPFSVLFQAQPRHGRPQKGIVSFCLKHGFHRGTERQRRLLYKPQGFNFAAFI